MSRKGAHFVRWEPDKVVSSVLKDRVGPAYTKFGLIVERRAKEKLRKSESEAVKGRRRRWIKGGGHGVRTGTLRRSIHLANADYNWDQDNVEPSDGTPELGGQAVKPDVAFNRASLLIGSGLRYALPVHQGHDGFEGYHFLTLALDETKPELPGILDEFKDKK